MSEEERRRCIMLGICQATSAPGTSRRTQREVALAQSLEAAFGLSAHKDEKSTGNGTAVAEWIFEHFDLVPKGVGAALVLGYRPEFARGAEE